MKTRTTFILSLTAIITLAANSAFGAYSGGTGEPNNPYQIATKQNLLDLAANTGDYGKCFILTADIDLDPNLPGGQVFTAAIIAPNTGSSGGFQGTAFTGIFDGNGHKITNFIINGGDNLGLFGLISGNGGGSVKNLGLENCSVSGSSGSSYVGGLVGINCGSISNCYSTGAVSGGSNSWYVGGLVGENVYGSISNCYSTGAVSGSQYVGGLVGINHEGSISNCYSSGTVSGGSNSWYVGGLVGGNSSWNNGGTIISNCYSTGAVSGSSGSSDVGGLVGENDGSISNCYSTGAVTGGDNSGSLGGLAGDNWGSISNCYSTGAVTDRDNSGSLGGLAGDNYGSISNCYSTGAVSGSLYYVGGLVGDNNGNISSCYFLIITSGPDNGYGMPLTDAQMKQQASFVGWDFSYTDGDEADWFIQIDEYPILTWQISPADIYTDGKNNFKDFAIFTQYWTREDCAIYNNYCDWADLNFDGSVDIDDLIVLMSYWLQSGIYN